MINSIYVTGFREKAFSSDELAKLDKYKNKYDSIFSLLDNRDDNFSAPYETFKAEGRSLILYSEVTNIDDEQQNKLIEAVKELQSMFPDISIEVNDEEKKLL